MVTNRRRATVTAGVITVMLSMVAGCDQKQTPAPVTDPGVTVPSVPRTESAAPSTSLGTTIDDTAITAKVKSAFVADPEVKSLDITVETRKGEVQLSGFVDNQAQVDRAVDIARRTQGVTDVQNKLALKTPGTVGSAVDDTIITAKVKTALVRDDTVKALDISVRTNKGEVQLSGYVENETQVSRATEVARTVEGVKTVDNKMSLKR
jgi:hyperosmotically inducible protein